MDLRTIEWKNNAIKIIDQTQLPGELKYLYIKDMKTLWEAIRMLKVRGAPALGAAAALGVYLGIRNSRQKSFPGFKKELNRVISYIATSRPTAKNLFWALERMKNTAFHNKKCDIPELKKILFQEAQKIIEEDRSICRKIGYWGNTLIKNNDTILTVCNTGILATVDYGTALGVLYRAKEEGKKIRVFSSETRPLLQGARLTTWELKRHGIDVTLICDNMAAWVMKSLGVDKVIAGADRIAANGDTANKIGTYNLAVLSRFHKIPFYVAAPLSTFDISIKSGKDIPIEERAHSEVKELFFRQPVAPAGINVFNPAFDVTDSKLITAIITETGIILPPYSKNIKRALRERQKSPHKKL